MPGRIDEYGFVAGQDFETYDDLSSPDLASPKSRPQKTKEYRPYPLLPYDAVFSSF
ncbi:hypothetical protein [Acetobacter pasteurianus]|uniref:hypothetical protein n=1 Tax=Acetobacter pasteurianus TaxID=438 RepID=UPI000F552D2F